MSQVIGETSPVFQIAYFFFLLLVHTAAALTKYTVAYSMHTIGHTTGDFTD